MKRELDQERLRAELLAYVRRTTGDIDAEFSMPPKPLSGGADKHVFAFAVRDASSPWTGDLVLKLFGEDDTAERVALEAYTQETARELGCPAPMVVSVGDSDRICGGYFFVMQRAKGRTMLEALKRPSLQLLRVPPTLANLHLQLHAIDTDAFLSRLAAHGIERARARDALLIERELELIEGRVRRVSRAPLRAGLQWIRANAPRTTRNNVLCHGDFHMSNVVVQDGRVTGVIDWSITKLADPAYDVGRTTFLMMMFRRSDLPRMLGPLEPLLRRSMSATFLRIYRRTTSIDDGALAYYQAFHALRSYAMGSEALIDDPQAGAWHNWAGARTLAQLSDEFRRVTGLSLA